MSSNTSFEDRLLAELRQVVALRPAPAAPLPARRARRPFVLATGAVTAAAAAAAVVLAAGGGTATPAYAVERQADGSVTVSVNSLADADGLEAKLRAVGIPAVVDYTPAGKMCRQPRGRAGGPGSRTGGSTLTNGHSASFTIGRDDVKPGETLVITSSLGEGVTSLGMQIVDGPVAPCELVDAPAPPPQGGHTTGGDHGLSNSTNENGGPGLHTGP